MSKPGQPQPSAALMNLNRFEAFTDAVIAIVMTLLVIEIKVPKLPPEGGGLGWMITTFGHHVLSYVTSFIVIGVIWLNHHALFHLLKRVDRTALILNLLLLMSIAFIPFSTALMGENPGHTTAAVFYGLCLGLTGSLYNLLWLYVMRQYIRAENLMTTGTVQRATFWSLSFPLSYFAAAALAPVSYSLALLLYAVIPLYYLLPGVIDRHIAVSGRH